MKQPNSIPALLPLAENKSKTDAGKGIDLLPAQCPQANALFDKHRKKAEEIIFITPGAALLKPLMYASEVMDMF